MWDYADSYKKDQFAFAYCTVHELMYKRLAGRRLKDFFAWNGYQSFALCGLSSLGLLLLEQLRNEGIEPQYAIDKRPEDAFASYGIRIIHPQSIHGDLDVDVVIVCHVFFYNEIYDMLIASGVPANKIVSINDVVFSV